MILECVIALFFTTVTCGFSEESLRKLTPRITGTGYSEIRRVPFQAQLIRDDANLFCGASIIAPLWLLSASHCFVDGNLDNVKVLSGSTFRINGQESYIDKVFKHPEFDPQTLDHDICLIKLKEPLEFNEKRKAVAMIKSDIKTGQAIQISGYGRESDFSSHSPVLKVANVPVVDISECRDKYSKVNDTITESMFCAGDGRDDACIGDSGGPAVSEGFLVGVISAGRFCRSKDFPGVYTRLDVHWEWIKTIVWSNTESFEKQQSS